MGFGEGRTSRTEERGGGASTGHLFSSLGKGKAPKFDHPRFPSMVWSVATLVFSDPECPASAQLQEGEHLQNLEPAATRVPVGYLEGEPNGHWEKVASAGERQLCRMSDTPCNGCALQTFPSDLLLLENRIEPDRMETRVAVPDVERLFDVMRDLEEAGLEVELVSLVDGETDGTRETLVDLESLTGKQRRALRAAHRMGYFSPSGGVTLDDVADAMDLGRSTVHEHLQKGMETLLEEALGPGSVGSQDD